MRKYFVIAGFAAAILAAGLAARAGTEGTSMSSGGVRRFTLDQAILTALQRNPTLLVAEQEIKRTKGVIIEIRAQALPHITPAGSFEWTDPNLIGARILGTSSTTTGGTTTGSGTTSGTTGAAASVVDSPASQVRDAQAVAAPSATPGVTNTELSD